MKSKKKKKQKKQQGTFSCDFSSCFPHTNTSLSHLKQNKEEKNLWKSSELPFKRHCDISILPTSIGVRCQRWADSTRPSKALQPLNKTHGWSFFLWTLLMFGSGALISAVWGQLKQEKTCRTDLTEKKTKTKPRHTVVKKVKTGGGRVAAKDGLMSPQISFYSNNTN